MGNEAKKKERESQCLNKAVKLGLMQHGKSLRIIQRLASPDFDDCDHERPDFIKLYKDPSSAKSSTVVGIEQFRVDRMSLLTKDNKVASVGIVAHKDVEKLFNKYHETALHGDIPESAFDDIGQYVSKYAQNQERSSYHTLLESFKYSLNLHLNSVDQYRKNLLSISNGKYPIELVFLIEIHADFYGLYRADDRGIGKQEDNLMPIFEEMVQFMEENIDSKKVNYVVLCIENGLGCGDCKVIAFSTKNIRKELVRQRIRVYEYAGEDLQYPKFEALDKEVPIESRYDTTEDGANIHLRIPKDDAIERYNGALQEMEHAYNLIKCGKNVMMTSAVYGCFSAIQESCSNRENNTNDET